VIGKRLMARRLLRLAAFVGLLCTATGAWGLSGALGRTIGTVPPARPAANCIAPKTLSDALGMIDYCRAHERVGPVTLPKNWSSLTQDQQMLVIFDLERIGRGLAPIIGLNSRLDSLAQTGADKHADPAAPSSGISAAGSVWAAASSTLGADYEWMYDDGPGGINEDCTRSDKSGCWGHRDNILIDSSRVQLIGGAGYAADIFDGANSYAFEMDYPSGSPSSYPADAFTWSSELADFLSSPGADPLPPPKITSVSPSSGRTSGRTTVRIAGSALSAVTQVRFGAHNATHVRCSSDDSCTAVTPAATAGSVRVTARNPAGTSSAKGPRFAYKSRP
jgi:hypothetical protein